MLEKDVAVILRDSVTIYVDVLRPAGAEKVPVIVAWSPYGKGQGTSRSVMGVFGLVGLDNGIVSGLEKFEGPDPAYWCAHGYAICNPDIRGVGNSEGDSVLWDRQEGEDCHDLVEWLAVQEWCSDVGFAKRLQDFSFRGQNLKEDILAEAERYPLMSGLWGDKISRFDRITVPAYVVASYSNTLHTAGTFRAWRRMASEEKWLRIHNSQEWPDYYDEANREDLRRFFDHYLKGEDNEWEQTPRVRYCVLDLKGGDFTTLAESPFDGENGAFAG